MLCLRVVVAAVLFWSLTCYPRFYAVLIANARIFQNQKYRLIIPFRVHDVCVGQLQFLLSLLASLDFCFFRISFAVASNKLNYLTKLIHEYTNGLNSFIIDTKSNQLTILSITCDLIRRKIVSPVTNDGNGVLSKKVDLMSFNIVGERARDENGCRAVCT